MTQRHKRSIGRLKDEINEIKREENGGYSKSELKGKRKRLPFKHMRISKKPKKIYKEIHVDMPVKKYKKGPTSLKSVSEDSADQSKEIDDIQKILGDGKNMNKKVAGAIGKMTDDMDKGEKDDS